jgi:hypothetical protein
MFALIGWVYVGTYAPIRLAGNGEIVAGGKAACKQHAGDASPKLESAQQLRIVFNGHQ